MTVAPEAVRAETVSASGHVTSGASATGGGGGLGALGVLLHPAPPMISVSSARRRVKVSKLSGSDESLMQVPGGTAGNSAAAEIEKYNGRSLWL